MLTSYGCLTDMPKQNLTLAQIEDAVGLPIVILAALDADTDQQMQLRLRDLPATAIAVALRWLNDRLPSTP